MKGLLSWMILVLIFVSSPSMAQSFGSLNDGGPLSQYDQIDFIDDCKIALPHLVSPGPSMNPEEMHKVYACLDYINGFNDAIITLSKERKNLTFKKDSNSTIHICEPSEGYFHVSDIVSDIIAMSSQRPSHKGSELVMMAIAKAYPCH